MKAAMLITLLGLAGEASAEEAWWLRVRADGKTLLFRPDGTGRTEVPAAGLGQSKPSADGASIVAVKDDAIHIADADGKNSRKVSPDGLVAGWPCLSPDGRRIAFVGLRDKQWQLHTMDRDGGNVRQLTDGPEEAGVGRPVEDAVPGVVVGAFVDNKKSGRFFYAKKFPPERESSICLTARW